MPGTSMSLSWRKIPERYGLIGTKCGNCGKYYFPSREICPTCRRKGKISKHKFKGKGKIYAYTYVTAPPKGFELQAPYVVGIIELDEGARATGQIVDAKLEDLYIGMTVEFVFRKLVEQGKNGVIHYGFKFRPEKKTLLKKEDTKEETKEWEEKEPLVSEKANAPKTKK